MGEMEFINNLNWGSFTSSRGVKNWDYYTIVLSFLPLSRSIKTIVFPHFCLSIKKLSPQFKVGESYQK